MEAGEATRLSEPLLIDTDWVDGPDHDLRVTSIHACYPAAYPAGTPEDQMSSVEIPIARDRQRHAANWSPSMVDQRPMKRIPASEVPEYLLTNRGTVVEVGENHHVIAGMDPIEGGDPELAAISVRSIDEMMDRVEEWQELAEQLESLGEREAASQLRSKLAELGELCSAVRTKPSEEKVEIDEPAPSSLEEAGEKLQLAGELIDQIREAIKPHQVVDWQDKAGAQQGIRKEIGRILRGIGLIGHGLEHAKSMLLKASIAETQRR